MISFYNTLTKKIEPFKAINQGKVTLYTCGPTVYNYPQIGNWVAFIRWDILVRLLQQEGYEVIRVMNITDVGHLVSDADEGEDKLEKGAKREGKSAWEIAAYYTDDFMIGMDKFNLIKPTYLTKATDYINEQIDLITVLESKGYTYRISDGIYFDSSKFKDYGKLANLNLKSLQAGARVEYNQEKRNIYDFALWKLTPAGQKRDMEWDSPWGKGFPGWHLECSAMALAKLGDTIDIHTGGIDHIPVHHTNEIAQSQSATGKKFANYWLHNNFLLVDGAKAAKSLGNAYTLQDIESKGFSAIDFKLFVLQSHYRTASNFTWDNLEAAKNRLNNWRNIADLKWQAIESLPDNNMLNYISLRDRLLDALGNDMDTPNAMVTIENYFNNASKGFNKKNQLEFVKAISLIQDLLGLTLVGLDITKHQKDLIDQRWQAKINKEWDRADKIREDLSSQGINIRDFPDYQLWESN